MFDFSTITYQGMGDRDHNPEPAVYDALNNGGKEKTYENITVQQQQQHQPLQQQESDTYDTVTQRAGPEKLYQNVDFN